ncbi:MAG: TolC family protein [Gemmatimonadaceae bacterium]|nr:TolC family protein [Gemmatimonadaceae bacterium]
MIALSAAPKRAVRVAGALLVSAAPTLAQSSDSAQVMSLAQAVDAARRNAPQVVAARGQERTAGAAIRSNRLSWLPNVNVNAGAGKTQGVQFFQGTLVPLRGDPWNFNNGLGANLVLFDGGARLFQGRQARAQADAAEANTVAQRYAVAFSVKQQYYAVLAARESEAAARVQLEQAQQQLKASVARVSAGVATKSDSLRSVIQVGNAELQLLSAQNDVRIANAALTRLVASPTPVTADPRDTLDVPTELPADTLLERLAFGGPAVEQARASLGAARAVSRNSKTPYLPTLSTNFNYALNATGRGVSTSNLWLIGDGNRPSRQTLNFTIALPLFDQGQREANVVNASVAEQNAEAQLRDARLEARQLLTQQLKAFETAGARVRVQLATIEAAEEDLRVQQQRYNLGASTLLDVLTSQAQLNASRTALIQARLDARVAKAQIEAIVGRDL